MSLGGVVPSLAECFRVTLWKYSSWLVGGGVGGDDFALLSAAQKHIFGEYLEAVPQHRNTAQHLARARPVQAGPPPSPPRKGLLWCLVSVALTHTCGLQMFAKPTCGHRQREGDQDRHLDGDSNPATSARPAKPREMCPPASVSPVPSSCPRSTFPPVRSANRGSAL